MTFGKFLDRGDSILNVTCDDVYVMHHSEKYLWIMTLSYWSREIYLINPFAGAVFWVDYLIFYMDALVAKRWV